MKILITGANGQVGACITQKLDNLADIKTLPLTKELLNIANKQAVFDKINEFKPDVVINCAAYTAVDKAEQDTETCYAINELGPKYLAQACNTINATLLHISTDYVFDGTKPDSYSEDDITNPQSVYGHSKLAGEIEVAKNCKKHIILRTAWVFGEHGNNFVKTMLKLVETRDTLGIVADQFGGPTYAGDIADTLITITQQLKEENNDLYGIYHFSGMPHVSWYDFATEIFQSAKRYALIKNIPNLNAISSEEFPVPAKRPQNSKLCCDKIEKNFSIKSSNWQKTLEQIQEYKS